MGKGSLVCCLGAHDPKHSAFLGYFHSLNMSFFPRRPIFPRRILPQSMERTTSPVRKILPGSTGHRIFAVPLHGLGGRAAALSQLSTRMNLNMSNRKCQSSPYTLHLKSIFTTFVQSCLHLLAPMVSMARCCQELWKASNLWVPAAADPGWVPNIPAQ